MRVLRLLLPLAALLLSTGCESATLATLAADEDLVTMYVAGHTADCMGLYPQKCLLVRTSPTAEWQYFYDHIDGFTHTFGYQHELEVAVREIPNPPRDLSSRAHRLIRVVSRQRVLVPLGGATGD